MDKNKEHQSAKDIREKNNQRNLWMAILTLVFGGSLLSGFVYGWQAIFSALPFLLIGAALILIPWLVIQGLGKFLDWMESEE